MDWPKITTEFVRAIRGKRSQVALARRLGYRGNPIAAWEAGRRVPTALELLRACELLGFEVAQACHRFHPGAHLPSLEQDDAIAVWLSDLRGSVTALELAKRTGASRHQVSRWLRGHTQPRMSEFLALLNAITGRATDWVVEVVGAESVPTARTDHQRRRAARELAHDEPWTEAIMRVLECQGYRQLASHEPGFIAKRLGISLETEARCLERMRAARIVSRRRGRFVPVASLTVETHARGRLQEHWARVAAERAAAPAEGELFAYNVLSASQEDVDRIEALLRATYREIRNIVSHTRVEETAVLVNLHLLRWQ